MKKILIAFIIGLPFLSGATHIIAGEITYRALSYLTYQATVTIYTDANSPVPTDTVTLRWGDNTSEIIYRSNGAGQTLPFNVLRSVYVSQPHTYAGPSPFFVISVQHFNRINYIININSGNSDGVPLYLEDTLRLLNPLVAGVNSSPVLLSLPLDFANVNDTFYHNPIAFDADGDSLAFSLITPFANRGAPVPLYRYPDAVPPVPFNQFTINAFTGEIIWATPKQPGIYNIAILVTEFRSGIKLGTVLRDMQITVGAQPNNPPRIDEFENICVIAGTNITRSISAADPNPQSVTLTAEGGPLRLSDSPASFTGVPGNPATGVLTWQTTCAHIRPQPYQVVFKAQDNYTFPLVDLKTWMIRVVAPAPENLLANAQGNHIQLSWNQPYACAATADFTGFSVWRKENSNPFIPNDCETGLAGRGYVKIASGLLNYNYTDENVTRGKTYCYRLLAEFAKKTQAGLFYNKTESLPSNESCAELKLDLPVIKNVSVTATSDVAGKILVAWYRPKADAAHLDTTQLTGPYSFKVYRSEGFGFSNPVEVAVFSNPFFGNLKDTVITDSLLNTVASAYTYRVAFFAGGSDSLGAGAPASSVFAVPAPASRRITLSWQESVPWQNFSYVIFREGASGFFPLDTVTGPSFTDTGLANSVTYCYYVMSAGSYSSALLPDTLLNNSQRVCATPVDNEPPCPPLLMAESPCAGDATELCRPESDPQNRLHWMNVTDALCDDDARTYNIYYAENTETSFTKIATVTDDFFFHRASLTLSGRYAVTAVDSAGNESAFSNVISTEHCRCYNLPNVFTPNNDSRNDYFVPLKPYRFVEKIEIKIFNRWGTLVFETTDPEIRWDGNDINSGKPVTEGVYYYVCAFPDAPTALSHPASPLSGYIHVIRSKGDFN